MIRIGRDRFGAALRPCLWARASNDDEATNHTTQYGLGLSLEAPLSSDWTLFGALEGGRIEFDRRNVDGDYAEALLGLAWRPAPATLVRASVMGRETGVIAPALQSDRVALRLDLSHTFRPGFAAHDWTVSTFAQSEKEDFGTRRDDETRQLGLSLRMDFANGLYLQNEISFLDRTSTVRRFNTEETMVSVRLGWEF